LAEDVETGWRHPLCTRLCSHWCTLTYAFWQREKFVNRKFILDKVFLTWAPHFAVGASTQDVSQVGQSGAARVREHLWVWIRRWVSFSSFRRDREQRFPTFRSRPDSFSAI
jgi:hypothetical protein